MDGDSYLLPEMLAALPADSLFNPLTFEVFVANALILILIFISAIMSASEVAYFSLTQPELDDFRESDNAAENRVALLMEKPRYLLSTILITNNLVNIGVVILSYFVTKRMLNFIDLSVGGILIPGYVIEFSFNVVIVTMVLVILGEATPKVYATHNKFTITRRTSGIFSFLIKLYRPVNWLLIGSTRALEKRLKKRNTEIDIEEINKAIEITVEKENLQSKEDAKLLKGVVQLGNITVKQIMRPRVDVVAVDASLNFHELIEKVKEQGYSRMPVYEDSLDHIVGILYIKDILEHLNQGPDFGWQKLLREPLFVPETKRIDDLLREIQASRKHIAIVVDEYGGTNGIVTLEDIVEEVVGDINDEFDVADTGKDVRKIAEGIFLTAGKVTIDKISEALNRPESFFDEAKGDAETVGGMVLELLGRIPKVGEYVQFKSYKFTVTKMEHNRIEELKIEYSE